MGNIGNCDIRARRKVLFDLNLENAISCPKLFIFMIVGFAIQACGVVAYKNQQGVSTDPVTWNETSVVSKIGLSLGEVNLFSSAGSVVANISGDQALGWLEHGNQRYTHHILRADSDREVNRRLESARQQHPHAVVISCSDSIVPPEIIFDQKIGEIYVVRTAGEQLDAAGVASVEFAVRKFGIQLVYVLAHNHCETIAESLKYKPTLTTTSSTLDSLLAQVQEKIFLNGGDQDSNPDFRESPLARRNIASADDNAREAIIQALGVAQDLETHSSLLRQRVTSHSLLIKTGVYRSESGQVQTQ